MISEVIPSAYDFFGKKIIKPTGKRAKIFHPTFPVGSYLSQKLSNKFNDINELRKFLCTCRYISDEKQFGKKDYWLTPEEFEKCKKGDCEDFALYTWRQLIEMGIKSRFVVGESGIYGSGHAWVTMEKDGKCFLCEPLACAFRKLPRLSMIRYVPEISVEFNEGKISYYSHKKIIYNPSLFEAITLFKEWLFYWAEKWIIIVFSLILLPFKLLRRLFFHNKRVQGTGDFRRP
jgi:glycosyltransferase involved in cell wall biosynthesis